MAKENDPTDPAAIQPKGGRVDPVLEALTRQALKGLHWSGDEADAQALYHLARHAADQSHPIPPAAVEVLKGHGLLEADGRLHPSVRDVAAATLRLVGETVILVDSPGSSGRIP